MKRSLLLGLLLLSSLGIMSVLYATPRGAGGLYDSEVYIGTAMNLAKGVGFYTNHKLPQEPSSHWAPLYPLFLAMPAYFGIDPTESARWVNGFFLACSIFLAGLIGWRYCDRNWTIGFLSALLILFSPGIINIHSQVLSETLFITLVLACILMLLSFAESGETKYLMGVAIAISAALVTRYAGLFLLPAACFIGAIIFRQIKHKSLPLKTLLIGSIVAVLPLSIWTMHNFFLKAGVVGNRKMLFHRLTFNDLRNLVDTLTLWFAPAEVNNFLSNYIKCFVIVAVLAIVVGILVSAVRSERFNTEKDYRLTFLLSLSCLIFNIVYIIVLLMTIAFVDRSTPLDLRLLIPLYPVTVLLLISSITLSRKIFNHPSLIYRIMLVIIILVFSSNSARFYAETHEIRSSGLGFQKSEYQDDEIADYIRHLPNDIALYSDDWGCIIHRLTHRAPYVLPLKYNYATTLTNNEYENQMMGLAELGSRNKVVIVLFCEGWQNSPWPKLQELTIRDVFHPVLSSKKGNFVLSSGMGPPSQITDQGK